MRGVIKNRERKRQIVDMSGLRFPNGITPTDGDGFIEFDDQLFVWFEFKVKDAPIPYGQRLALERQCDAVAETGRIATVFVAEHDTAPAEDIDAAACMVRELRFQRKWRPPRQPITLREAIDRMREMAGML